MTCDTEWSNYTSSICANIEMEHQPNRPSCLAKQDQFESEEIDCVTSPVMIQIEEGSGGIQDGFDQDDNDGARFDTADDASSDGDGSQKSRSNKSSSRYSPGPLQSGKPEKSKQRSSHQRVKLLVRSQAVHDDTSPPPDPDVISTNTNMLSVTCASLFSSQNQSKISTKPNQLVRQGSSLGSTQGSMEGSSPSLSRDSSTETYMESTGIDIQQFIIDTLHKNQKDRMMLLKIEQELINLVKDGKRQSHKFPQMSSYNRMLVHRVAAFFRLDHYVDQNGTSVIVNKTKNTRLPDIKFREQIHDELVPDEPKKSILKRDSTSFEEGKESSSSQEGLGESPLCYSQEGTYSSSRRSSQEDLRWASEPRPWSSTDSDSSGRPHLQPGMKSTCSSFEFEGGSQTVTRSSGPFTVLSKSDIETKELLIPSRGARPAVTKASSFGGISVPTHDIGGKGHTPRITKAESFNVTTLSSSYSNSNMVTGVVTTTLPEPATSPADSNQLTVPSVVQAQSSPAFQTQSVETNQGFPVIVGQSHSLSLSQVSSQTPANWQTGSRDSSISSDLSAPQVNQPVVWPGVDGIPAGSVLLGPQTGTPYMNVDGTVYRTRQPNSIGGQTMMVTPFQTLTTAAPQIQVATQISHPQQQQQQQQQQQTQQQPPPPPPPPPPPQQQQQPQQSQQQPHRSIIQQPFQQQMQSQTSLQPTIVYVPYVAPQFQPQVSPQPPSVSQLTQQPIPPDQRQLNLEGNNSNMDLITQLSVLSFIPTQSTGQPQSREIIPPGSVRGMESSTSTLMPQGYVIPVKNQVSGGHQSNVTQQLPVYYVPQVPQNSSLPPVRYIYPTTSIVQTPVQQSSSTPNIGLGIGNQGISDIQTHMSQPTTQHTQQMTGSPYLPSYPMLGFSHGESSNMPAYLNYTAAAQTGVSSVTSTTSGMSIPLFPHNTILTNIANGAQVLASPNVSQASQPPNYVSPITLNTPTGALPMYVVTTSTTSPVSITTPHIGNGMNAAPYTSYRVQTPPAQPNNGTGSNTNNISLGSPFLSYTLYTPAHSQHLPAPPNVNNNIHSPPVPSNQFTPSFLSTFQVLRPGIPIVSNIRNNTPPPSAPPAPPPPPPAPPQNLIPPQFPTPPPPPPGSTKRQLSFPIMKPSELNVRDMNIGTGNSRQDQKGRTAPLHVGNPTTGLICRRGLSLMQDMCLLGHPLQHQLNPLILQQQRPLARYPHPNSAPNSIVSNKPPKLRKQRSKSGNVISNVGRGNISNTQSTCGNISNTGTNHVLEVEGIPEGMKRSEIERYLEQVINHGAKIQFVSIDGGITSPGADLTINSKYKVLAVFESDTAAQSAQLNIKTAKFQLRQRRNGKDGSMRNIS